MYRKAKVYFIFLKKVNRFLLRKEGTKTGKHFLIFQKLLATIPGCKALPFCLQLVWYKDSDRCEFVSLNLSFLIEKNNCEN